MTPILGLFVFAFGTIIGSFLNAVLWRLRTGESFVIGRSYCPGCRHRLSAKDLVPALSYLLLGGRCRYCRMRIDAQYLLVELATGLLFLAFAAKDLPPLSVSAAFPDGAALARLLLHWYFAAVLVLVFVYDLRYMIILRRVTLPAAAAAFVGNALLGENPALLLLAAAAGGGFFYLQRLLSGGRWVGGGDVHLGLLMGAMVGWPWIFVALLLAYVSGALAASVLLISGRKGWKSQLPFGTFLSAATVVTLLWGREIVGWYFGLLL